MSGNDAKILLAMNFPTLEDELFELDAAEFKKVCKTFKKLKGLAWSELFKDSGLNWEQLRSAPGKYSVRLSQSYRAVVRREGPFMRFRSSHLDHGGA